MIRLFALLLFFSSAAFALNVDVPLADATQEARAKSLFHEIRCVVCQSEAIADSPAEVATDMRRSIREDIANGASNDDIKRDLVIRYGDGILMKPPLKSSTAFLWFGPWLILALGAIGITLFFRKKP